MIVLSEYLTIVIIIVKIYYRDSKISVFIGGHKPSFPKNQVSTFIFSK